MLITTTDMLIRIKNGYMAHNSSVIVSYTNITNEICKLLVKLGYLESFQEKEIKGKKSLEVFLRYTNGKPAIQDIKIISKPGRKMYSGFTRLKPVLGGLGHIIMSTSKGIITDKEAKKMRIGGEIICYIW